MKPRVVVGVGAAVVVAGVSLGGPLPVAAADDTGVNSSVEARSQAPGPAAPSRRPVRSRPAAEPAAAAAVLAAPAPRAGQVRDRSATASSVRAPGWKPAQRPAPAATDRTRRLATAALASELAQMRAAVATQPMPAAVEAALTPPAASVGEVSQVAPAALRRAATERSGDPAVPVLRRAPGMAAVNLAHAMDTLGTRLSGRANPFTDAIAGGLWLVRRSLFPVGADVGLWGSAGCVATKDCSGQDLTGADFTRQDLTAVDFTNAVLRSVNFRNADLTVADLTGAAITGAQFNDATLVGTTLTGVSDADLISASWRGANLSGQDFSGRTLYDANTGTAIDFSGTDLTDAKFIGTTLVRAGFNGSVLTRADLSIASLQGANFYRATLVDAKLIWADASAAPRQAQAVFVEANLTGADLTGAGLARSVLSRANLTDADLTRADLTLASQYRVTWKNTTCPDGSKTDTGCSGWAPAAGAVPAGPLVAGVGRALGGVVAGVDRVLGAASQWLSGFPGAVASVVVGALDQVRRSLRDFVVGLPGWSVSGTSVEVKNRTDQVLVLRQDPDGIRGGSQTGQQWVFLDPGQNATFSGYHSEDKAVDVLLSVNLAKKVGEDWIATDETRMVLVANNTWLVTPELRVEAVDPASLQDGKNLNRAYLAYRASEFLWIDTWSLLSEGEDCHCDAVNSGGPADGPQVYVGRRDDSDDYKNFYVEIFSVGATPTGGGKDIYPVNRDARYYCNGKGEKRQGGGGWV